MQYERLTETRTPEEAEKVHAMHQTIATSLLRALAQGTEKVAGRTTSEDFENIIALMKTDYIMVMKEQLPEDEFEKLATQFAWCTTGIMAPFVDRMAMIEMVNRAHDSWEEKQREG